MMKHNMPIIFIWEELPILSAPTSDRNQQEITGTWVMGLCLASLPTVLFVGPCPWRYRATRMLLMGKA